MKGALFINSTGFVLQDTQVSCNVFGRDRGLGFGIVNANDPQTFLATFDATSLGDADIISQDQIVFGKVIFTHDKSTQTLVCTGPVNGEQKTFTFPIMMSKFEKWSATFPGPYTKVRILNASTNPCQELPFTYFDGTVMLSYPPQIDIIVQTKELARAMECVRAKGYAAT
jgi:hypothetical protein